MSLIATFCVRSQQNLSQSDFLSFCNLGIVDNIMSGIILPNTYPQIEVKNEFYSEVEPNADNTSGPFKVLLLGDAAVGKTSLIKRLITGKFLDKTDSNYIATIGIDYKRKTIRIEENKFVKLQIWDTAGQERFRGLAKNYYRGADAVVLVYDVTQARTFVDVPSWLEELETFSLDERKILQVIVANKVRRIFAFTLIFPTKSKVC